MAPPRPSLTGFDMKKFVASSGQPANDPWKRNEAWRYQGVFTRRERFRGMFPGFGIAAVAFGVYCIAEAVLAKPHEEHHAQGEHH